jgi:sulfur-carrier protein adenylyltransferase/sulfurtransferase
MLAGKGFENVMNMAGGIRAWDNPVAMGSEEQGLALLDGTESPENTLLIAYSLEAGLRNFYLLMTEKVQTAPVRNLFKKLSDIEIKHQDRLFDEYLLVSGKKIDRESFDKQTTASAVEGGLTTEEYIAMFKPDLESPGDVVSLAMSIEAQALDLYTRASQRGGDARSKAVLQNIAQEERTHLEQLGQLFNDLQL